MGEGGGRGRGKGGSTVEGGQEVVGDARMLGLGTAETKYRGWTTIDAFVSHPGPIQKGQKPSQLLDIFYY